MKVPFVKFSDIYTQNKEEILGALDRVFSAGELCLGDYGKDITELEKWFAEFVGVKHAIMVGSGTQALYLAYKAIGVGETPCIACSLDKTKLWIETYILPWDWFKKLPLLSWLPHTHDEVITVAHTFSATFDQIIALGATPILVDIGEDGLIDPKEVEKAITPRTKAIVPVHLEGKVCDMVRINEIAREHDLFVVQDAAQAIGADFHAETSCFSLYPAKIFGTLGNAGMVTTNDDDLAYKVSMLRCNYRFEKDPTKVDYGFNYEPDNAWAAVLNVRKKYLPDYIKRREEIAKVYLTNLRELEYRGLIKLPREQEGRVWQDFVLRINNPKDKEEFLTFLKEKEIGFLGHDVPYYPDYPKLNLKFDLPKTRQYIKEQVRIPLHPFLTDDEIMYVIANIREFFDKK